MSLDSKVARAEADLDKLHNIVHGDAGTIVETEGGNVESLARAVSRISTSAVSSSTVTVGTGSKTWAAPNNRGWVLGQRLRVASADLTKILEGEVTAYADGELTLAVDFTEGAGSDDEWIVALTGARGTKGDEGDPGPSGGRWYGGMADPAGETGANGDWYLQGGVGASGAVGDVWQKVGGAWVWQFNNRGPAGSGAGDLLAANNLSDLDNATTARTNLGLGGLAVKDSAANADLADMAQSTVKGRAAGAGSGVPGDLTAAQLAAILAGTAMDSRGRHAIWLPARALLPRVTSGSAEGLAETTAQRVNRQTLDFDAAVAEYAQAEIWMPKSWGVGTLRVRFAWESTITSGNVVWAAQAQCITDGGSHAGAFGTAVSVTDAAPGTDNTAISGAAVVTAGSAGADRLLILQVYRDTTAGGDTLAGDARLRGLVVEFVTTAATDD